MARPKHMLIWKRPRLGSLVILALVGPLLAAAIHGSHTSGSNRTALTEQEVPIAEAASYQAPLPAAVEAVASTAATPQPLTPTPVPTTGAMPPKASRPVANRPPTRIRIPSIHVDADIVQVDYQAQLEEGSAVTLWKVADFAVGFHSGTAYPGCAGNTVLAGHNNIRGRVFRHLLDLRKGDDIYLYVGEQEFRYVVSEVLLVKEKGTTEEIRRENAMWIQPTADERLTLVSCWPFIKPDHRVFVIAFPPRD
jgi:sortase A